MKWNTKKLVLVFCLIPVLYHADAQTATIKYGSIEAKEISARLFEVRNALTEPPIPQLQQGNNYNSAPNDKTGGQLLIKAFEYAAESAPVEVKEDHLLSFNVVLNSKQPIVNALRMTISDLDFLIGSSRMYKIMVGLKL